MTEMTTTERKLETTFAAKTACAGLMTARHAGQATSKTEFTFKTEFGMRTSNN